MDVAIVKYNAGNIYSVVNAMKRLGISPILTDDAETLRKADRVLFPGQGQAREAMLYLKAHGLDETIKSMLVKRISPAPRSATSFAQSKSPSSTLSLPPFT